MATVLRVLALAFLVTLFGGSSACAQDDVVGIIWEIKFEHPSKKAVLAKFRATPDGKVWDVPERGKPKQLGTWSGDQSNTKLNLTSPGKGPPGTGTIEIVQVRKNPPVWQGVAIKKDGAKRTCKVRLVED